MPAHSCGAEDTDLLTQLCLSVDNRVLVHEDRLVHLGSVGDPPAASFMLMLILSLQIADHGFSSSSLHFKHSSTLSVRFFASLPSQRRVPHAIRSSFGSLPLVSLPQPLIRFPPDLQ